MENMTLCTEIISEIKSLYIVMENLLYLVCTTKGLFVKISNCLNLIINIECVCSSSMSYTPTIKLAKQT